MGPRVSRRGERDNSMSHQATDAEATLPSDSCPFNLLSPSRVVHRPSMYHVTAGGGKEGGIESSHGRVWRVDLCGWMGGRVANPFRSLGEMACWLAAATGSRWLARAAARGAPSRQCGYGSPTGWKGRWRRLLPAVRWGPWRRLPRPSGWRPWWSTPSPPRARVPLLCVEAYVTPRNLSVRPVLPKRWSAFALPVRLTLGQVLHGLRFSFPVCWRRPPAGPSSMPS